MCLHGRPPPLVTTEHEECGASIDVFVGFMDQSYVCGCVGVCVCVFRGAGGVCPRCTPTAATRLATCSGIREHADYTRHNGDTQTQICPRPTKDTHTHARTHRTASPLIACSIFNIFIVWEIMTLGAAHDSADDVYVCVD